MSMAVLDDEDVLLKNILDGVSGERETVRRTVYRMVDYGTLVCDADTRLYTVGNEEG
jgi:hypothetical protein